jgi:regulator of replication initiation timing
MEITDNTKTLANALAEIEILRKQLEDIPEGCTVADAKKLREANHALAIENFELKKKLEAADAEIKRLESAWHVETLNRKDQLIAEQEAENDRLKQIIREALEIHPVYLNPMPQQAAAIPEYNENVPADCLSPTVAKARRYGDPKNILSAAPKPEVK